MRKIILCYILSLVAFSSYAVSTNSAVEKYVDKVVNDASALLNNQRLSEKEKVAKSSKLIAQNLDLDWMAKYTLGRYKKGLTPAQVDNFIKIYSSYVIKTYSEKLKDYKDEKARVKGVQQLDQDEFIVKTEIVKGNGEQPIKVDYLVRASANSKNPAFKVADIITEGISMINSQQSEFKSIIANNSFEALINDLKGKI